MERYNITEPGEPQPLGMNQADGPGQRAVSRRRPLAASISMALLLHVVVVVALLTTVRLPAGPMVADEATVAMVFAQPRSSLAEAGPAEAGPAEAGPAEAGLAAPQSPPPATETSAVEAPVVPPRAPDVPTPPPPKPEAAARPAPEPSPLAPPMPVPSPEMPVEPPSPPLPAETKPIEAPPPMAAPPVTHRTAARTKSVGPPRHAAASAPSQAPPVEGPPQPAFQAPAAAAAIPGDWQHALAVWLAAHRTYPEEARRSGTEGSVALRFSVDRSGRVLDVVVARSAGSPLLDNAAAAMVRNATLPAFTANMPQETVTVTVQIRYTLAD